MPRARPRHSVIETDEVAAALRGAAERWPEDRDSPGRLLARLLRMGHEDDLAARMSVVDEFAGALTGTYPPGCLAELRDDWPE